MVGKVLTIEQLIDRDQLGAYISNKFREWDNAREQKKEQWRELRSYIYATDTKHTTNAKLPWSNSTTLPKLTQIRDNLYANYVATMFPKRKWLNWEGVTEQDENETTVETIKDYMTWVVSQPEFKTEVQKLVLDYIDYGNAFSTVEWVDESTEEELTGVRLGFVGPRVVRISPEDIVMNPTSSNFKNSPKIIRSLYSLGEAAEVLQRMSSTAEDKERAQKVYDYLIEVRASVGVMGDTQITGYDDSYTIDGFTSFHQYLGSDYVELLTFVGDIFDQERQEFLKNRMIVVMDRCKVIINQPFPFPVAEAPYYHSGWRPRQDNLWAMGPLDNLVGLQYRLDHIENMKSDILDLVTYPVIMVRGSGAVNDFEWGPLEKIIVDSDGDVALKTPDINALTANLELQNITAIMEEMAGSPKEAMGFRTPGEKTAYEVQRLENAASRIFQNKIAQFEEQMIERLLNAMLILARENLTDATIRVIDDEYGVISFRNITRADLAANGRLRPIAARHFAEQAELVQNLTNWASSPLGSNPAILQHFSSVKLARLIEDILNLQDYNVVTPYVALSEQAEAQRLAQAAQEQLTNEALAPTGLTPDDYSPGMIEEDNVPTSEVV